MNPQTSYTVSSKNIHATKLKEFWGDQFDDSIYLWLGSANDLRGDDIQKLNFINAAFSTKEEIEEAYQVCVELYYKFLKHLSEVLNQIHNVHFSEKFWQISFGLWFFRHVCNVYEKYITLQKLDIKNISIKLLSKESFYIPTDHYDYLMCFARDFGIQQLVTQYIVLEGVKFPEINYHYHPEDIESSKARPFYRTAGGVLKKMFKSLIPQKLRVNPKIALLGVYYSKSVVSSLIEKSLKQIDFIELPECRSDRNEIDMVKRGKILSIVAENKLEEYLINTLIYCCPKAFIEDFSIYYRTYGKDLDNKRFSHIVSEDWIGNTKAAIYVALAKEKNRYFVNREHGFGTFFYKNDYNFIGFNVADKFLSSGWRGKAENLVTGGFATRVITAYQPLPEKKNILYISRTVLLYEVELIDRNIISPHFVNDLKNIDEFIVLLDEEMKSNFILRPRRWSQLCWDTEYLLDLKGRSIATDNQDFSESIHTPRIIIIDHISTALAEILLTGTPFVLIYNFTSMSMVEDLDKIFADLKNCGVIQLNAYDAVSHLGKIYNDVQGWWDSFEVQQSLQRFIDLTIASPSGSMDYLLSLIKYNSN
jgi:putative transferase (TIGR04331 family)